MASTQPQSTEDLHFRVLKLLQNQPDLSQRELAGKLGVSNGKVHYCLRALIDKGLIKLANFADSKHRLRYAYLLTPAGISQKAGMTSQFLKRKIAEYEALRFEIAALQAEISPHHVRRHPEDKQKCERLGEVSKQKEKSKMKIAVAEPDPKLCRNSPHLNQRP